MKVTTIIPVRNRVDRIGRALRSILGQTRPPDEVIVVDDGSSDGTAGFVEANFPGVEVIRQPWKGPGAARNTGIIRACGDLIAFLDSDDVWLPEKLQSQLAVYAKYPGLGLVATQKCRNLDPAAAGAPAGLEYRVRFFPFTSFMKRTTVNTPTVLIPKAILLEAGLFDESLSTSEDWDLWARIAYRHAVARIEEPLVVVFRSPDSISLSRRTKYLNDVRVLAKWRPGRLGTYDTDHRLSRLLYERYVLTFTLLRTMRLIRHSGVRDTRDFLYAAAGLF